jgi:hypothetical protein
LRQDGTVEALQGAVEYLLQLVLVGLLAFKRGVWIVAVGRGGRHAQELPRGGAYGRLGNYLLICRVGMLAGRGGGAALSARLAPSTAYRSASIM